MTLTVTHEICSSCAEVILVPMRPQPCDRRVRTPDEACRFVTRSDGHAGCNDRDGLCRPRFRGVHCRFRSSGHLRRQGCTKISALNAGEIPIYEPGLNELVRVECSAGAAVIYHGAERSRGRCGRGVHRRRYPVTPRGRPCGSLLRLRGDPRDRRGAERLHRRHHEVDGSGRHRRRGRAHHSRDEAGHRCRRRLKSGILARRCRDP